MRIRILIAGRNYQTQTAVAPPPQELDLPEGASVHAAIAALAAQLRPEQRLPGSCLVAVSGMHVGTVDHCEDRPLRDGDELLLLAPVAGG